MNQHQPTLTPTIAVDFKEASRITSISQKVLRDEVNAGRIPAHRIGSRIAIDYDGLVAWYRSHPPVVEPIAESA